MESKHGVNDSIFFFVKKNMEVRGDIPILLCIHKKNES